MTTDPQSSDPPNPPDDIVEQLQAWAIVNNLVVDLHIARYPNSKQPRRSPGLAVAFTVESANQERPPLTPDEVARLHAVIDGGARQTSDRE